MRKSLLFTEDMLFSKNLVLFGLFAGCGAAVALKFGEKPKTPQLPGVPYVVHDGTRPQPKMVETAGAVMVKPPSDAKVLFNGTGLDAWKGGQWKVKEGLLIAHDKDLVSKEEFRDIQLHLEWRVEDHRYVDGQTGANSGVFLMGLYEIQILASHQNKTYPDGQAGAMYGQFPPLVNASAPKGEWNSYDITFTAPRYEGEKVSEPAKVTVFHNGVLLHHAKPYYGPIRYKELAEYPKEHPEKGPIKLQWHGDPVQFRNIWVREIGDYDQ